jgi:hypothetical protein
VEEEKYFFFQISVLERRQNFDVIHIEKNVMNNILGTILDIKGKTKDNLAARLGL